MRLRTITDCNILAGEGAEDRMITALSTTEVEYIVMGGNGPAAENICILGLDPRAASKSSRSPTSDNRPQRTIRVGRIFNRYQVCYVMVMVVQQAVDKGAGSELSPYKHSSSKGQTTSYSYRTTRTSFAHRSPAKIDTRALWRQLGCSLWTIHLR